MLLDALNAVEQWLATHPAPAAVAPRVSASVAVAHHVRAQDCITASNGTPTLRHGVAEDRRISVEDAEMRHGRKSRSLLVDGYKRHVLRDLDSRLIVAVGVTPANAPEASVTDAIASDLAAQQQHAEGIAHRPSVFGQYIGATTRRGDGDFLQGLAGAAGAVFSQKRLCSGLATARTPVSGWHHNAL